MKRLALQIPISSSLMHAHGPMDFENILKSTDKTSRCYFVGRPAIAENLEELCRRRGMTYWSFKMDIQMEEKVGKIVFCW